MEGCLVIFTHKRGWSGQVGKHKKGGCFIQQLQQGVIFDFFKGWFSLETQTIGKCSLFLVWSQKHKTNKSTNRGGLVVVEQIARRERCTTYRREGGAPLVLYWTEEGQERKQRSSHRLLQLGGYSGNLLGGSLFLFLLHNTKGKKGVGFPVVCRSEKRKRMRAKNGSGVIKWCFLNNHRCVLATPVN